jgi:hypothetical protein
MRRLPVRSYKSQVLNKIIVFCSMLYPIPGRRSVIIKPASYLLVCHSLVSSHLFFVKMSDVESLESSVLTPDLREALRTLLSQNSQPYLDIPSTAAGPGICISTSLADFRRVIKAQHLVELDCRPVVPTNYRAGGGRRPLPNGIPIKPQYQNTATQTEPRPEPLTQTGQVESAPETRTRMPRRAKRPPVSRVICSSSTDTESSSGPGARARSVRRSQGWYRLTDQYYCTKGRQYQRQPLLLDLVRVRG